MLPLLVAAKFLISTTAPVIATAVIARAVSKNNSSNQESDIKSNTRELAEWEIPDDLKGKF